MKVRYLEVVSGLGMGGAEKSFLNRIRWAPERVQTSIINTRPELSVWAPPPEVPLIVCRRNRFSFPFRLRIEIERFNPHIVTVRSPVDLILVAFVRKITRSKWCLVYEAHSTKLSQLSFFSFSLAPVMRWALSQTNLTVAVSKSVAKGPQCFGAKDVRVHYFGAEVSQTISAPRKLVFLFVGRLVPLKQPLLLLNAVAALSEIFKESDARLQIVGAGPLEGEVRKSIETLGLSSFVELSGYSDDMDSIYARSEYLISTSRFEGLPISFFEAKLHGLRILTFPSSGDFDILGEEDVILKDFTEHEVKVSLELALMSGILSDNERKLIRERNEWMNAKLCAIRYYELLDRKFKLLEMT